MSAQQYFQQHNDYFWQWEEGGEVLAIPGGSTIAYKGYITDILEKLLDPGLPPFGSLLLVLVATSPDADASLFAVRTLVEKALDRVDYTGEPLRTALSVLKELSLLPPKYKQGKNRLLLLHTLFADCHNRLSYQRSKNVYDSFCAESKTDEQWLTPKPFFYNLYHEDFRVVELLSRKFPDRDALIERLAALPLIEEEIKLEQSEVQHEPEKDFVDTLVENSKTFHVGSLVKRLWSGLNIPHHNSLPSRQPLGGVSDLTNKGEFHRLLISEFANDDVLFLSRLANNEALYINREVPPQANDLERLILIDVSIKNWGTPRTVAYALLLAIAKHPKTNIACSAFAVGEDYHPIRFHSVDDIIEGLQLVESCLHPAKGLQAFLKTFGSGKNKEVFFISCSETYKQPEVHKVISDHYNFFNYWIQTNSSGVVELYKRQQASKKHVQHLHLPLEELWKKEPNATHATTHGQVALHLKTKYPILFPAATNPRKIMMTEGGEVFIITIEWNLMRLYDKTDRHAKAWEMIYENLPRFSGDAQIGIDEKGRLLVLLFNEPNKKITILDVENDCARSIHFHEYQKSDLPYAFLFHENSFVCTSQRFLGKWWTFFLNDQIVVHAENSSALLDEKLAAKTKQMQGRYFSSYFISTVFKNIKEVYINQVDNLVFSKRELRLTDDGQFLMEKTNFLTKQIEARYSGKYKFRFPDGSTITVNRSGMLILQSSDPSVETIYVPSVVEAVLGFATANNFAGNEYYRLPTASDSITMDTRFFWKRYMVPFINTIKNHGA